MKPIDVITLGIAVIDIVAWPADRTLFDRANTRIEDITLATGGDAANQAADLAKLGRRAALMCRVGDDSMGRMLLSEMAGYGADVSHVVVSPESVTATAIVLVSKDGQRSIISKRGSNDDFCLADIDLELIAQTKVLSVGSLFGCVKLEEDGLETVLKQAKRNDVTTFADMAADKKGLKLKGIAPFLPYIDWFLPSEYDSAYLTDGLDEEDAARVFMDAGVKNVAIKLGRRGAYARCEGFTGYVPAFKIEAKDTTGSGDAFCAGMIHSLLDGNNTEEALTFACACGAFNALYSGAACAPINPEAIRRFIETTSRISLR